MATGDFLHLESDRAAATKLEQSEYASVTGHGITGGLTGELLVFNGTKLLGALTHGTVLLPATTNLGGSLLAVNAAGPSLLNEAATATNPTLVPNRADPNTGVGWRAADRLSLIAGATEIAAFSANATSYINTNGRTFQLQDSGTAWLSRASGAAAVFTGTVNSLNAAGWALLDEAATSTNPTLIPNQADPDTGIGWSSADVGALVAGGLGRFFWSASYIRMQPGGSIAFNADSTGVAINDAMSASFDFNVATDTVTQALFVDAGAETMTMGIPVYGSNAAAYGLLDEAATSTNPTLVPNRADTDTGIGWTSADKLSLIAGGVNVVEVASSIVTINPGNANIDVQMRADADSNAFKFDASQYSGQGSFGFGDPGGAPDYIYIRPVVTLPSGQSFHGLRVAHQAITTAGDSGTHALITGGYFGSPAVTKGAGGDTITATASAYFTSVEGDGASNYAIFSDSGLNRFDGDGSNVFELPEDDTDPTSSGGAAVGRIPVKIGGSTHYIAYY